MDELISLTVVVISKHRCISKYRVVYLKYIQFLFVFLLYLNNARGKVFLYCIPKFWRESSVTMTAASWRLGLGCQLISHCLYQLSCLWPVGAVSGPSARGQQSRASPSSFSVNLTWNTLSSNFELPIQIYFLIIFRLWWRFCPPIIEQLLYYCYFYIFLESALKLLFVTKSTASGVKLPGFKSSSAISLLCDCGSIT